MRNQAGVDTCRAALKAAFVLASLAPVALAQVTDIAFPIAARATPACTVPAAGCDPIGSLQPFVVWTELVLRTDPFPKG